jgi:hypothetical protein
MAAAADPPTTRSVADVDSHSNETAEHGEAENEEHKRLAVLGRKLS